MIVHISPPIFPAHIANGVQEQQRTTQGTSIKKFFYKTAGSSKFDIGDSYYYGNGS